MKKAYVAAIAALAMLFTFSAVSFAGTNLLVNPGFEDWYTAWYAEGHVNEIMRSMLLIGGSPNQSALCFVNTVPLDPLWHVLVQDVTTGFEAGKPLYAKVEANTMPGNAPTTTSLRAGLMLQFFDRNGDQIGDTVKGSEIGGRTADWGDATDWSVLEVAVAKVPDGTVKVKYGLYIYGRAQDWSIGGSNAYFDNAYLVQEYYPVMDRSLLNPGFENGLSSWYELYGNSSFVENANIQSGTYASGLEVKSVAGQDYWSQIYQDVPCAGKTKMTASLYVNTDFTKKARASAGIEVQYIDNNNNVLKRVRVKRMRGDKDWKKLTIRQRIPKDAAIIRFSCAIKGPMGNVGSVGGKAYFDDAELKLE